MLPVNTSPKPILSLTVDRLGGLIFPVEIVDSRLKIHGYNMRYKST